MATDGVAGLDRALRARRELARSGSSRCSRDRRQLLCRGGGAARLGSRTGELAALSVGPSIELVRAR